MSNKYPISRNVTKIKLGKNKFKYSFKYKWNNGKPLKDDVSVQRINKLRIPPAATIVLETVSNTIPILRHNCFPLIKLEQCR